MRVKLVVGLALPLMIVSAPAMAFGLVGLIATLTSAAVGSAGGAALSSSGVGPASRTGEDAPEVKPLGRTAWASTQGQLAGLTPSRRGEIPHDAVRMRGLGWVNGSPSALAELGKALPSRPGAGDRTLRLCRNAIARELAPYGAVRVEAARAGPASRSATATTVPVTARVIYRHSAGYEVKRSMATCQLTKTGARLATR